MYAPNNNPLRPFKGTTDDNSDDWTQELILDIQQMSNFSDKQMIFFAKRAIKGVARYAIDHATPQIETVKDLFDVIKT